MNITMCTPRFTFERKCCLFTLFARLLFNIHTCNGWNLRRMHNNSRGSNYSRFSCVEILWKSWRRSEAAKGGGKLWQFYRLSNRSMHIYIYYTPSSTKMRFPCDSAFSTRFRKQTFASSPRYHPLTLVVFFSVCIQSQGTTARCGLGECVRIIGDGFV